MKKIILTVAMFGAVITLLTACGKKVTTTVTTISMGTQAQPTSAPEISIKETFSDPDVNLDTNIDLSETELPENFWEGEYISTGADETDKTSAKITKIENNKLRVEFNINGITIVKIFDEGEINKLQKDDFGKTRTVYQSSASAEKKSDASTIHINIDDCSTRLSVFLCGLSNGEMLSALLVKTN